MSHASYLQGCVTPDTMHKIINDFARQIKADKETLSISAIAIRGISGAVVGGALSFKTGLPLIVVRKPNDGTHSMHAVECDDDLISHYTRYVFVDDLIASGRTFDAVREAIEHDSGAKCVAVYLYASGENSVPYSRIPSDVKVYARAFDGACD